MFYFNIDLLIIDCLIIITDHNFAQTGALDSILYGKMINSPPEKREEKIDRQTNYLGR